MAFNVNFPVNGLGTTTVSVDVQDALRIHGNLTLPSVSKGDAANSQVVVTISIPGPGIIYTGVAGATGFSFDIAGIGGVGSAPISIILSSSAAVDQARINEIQGTVSISSP